MGAMRVAWRIRCLWTLGQWCQACARQRVALTIPAAAKSPVWEGGCVNRADGGAPRGVGAERASGAAALFNLHKQTRTGFLWAFGNTYK